MWSRSLVRLFLRRMWRRKVFFSFHLHPPSARDSKEESFSFFFSLLARFLMHAEFRLARWHREGGCDGEVLARYRARPNIFLPFFVKILFIFILLPSYVNVYEKKFLDQAASGGKSEFAHVLPSNLSEARHAKQRGMSKVIVILGAHQHTQTHTHMVL